jgi:two-component system, OmpR family, phosphate regulon response regulator PhoB
LKKILIAEDEEVLRMLITDTLEDENYDVDEAIDGGDALEKIMRNDYDLVILDYMMPVYTGMDVIKKVRALSHKKDMMIMMLSAKSQQQEREAILDAGANFFIAKPFSPMELLSEVGDILQ